MLATLAPRVAPNTGLVARPRNVGSASAAARPSGDGAAHNLVSPSFHVASVGLLVVARRLQAARQLRSRWPARTRADAKAEAKLVDAGERFVSAPEASQTNARAQLTGSDEGFVDAPQALRVGEDGGQAQAIRLFSPPPYRSFGLDMSGDLGFDPLNVSKDKKTLMFMREAELKHCRLAMLAAVGWPVSEAVQPWLAEAFHAPLRLVEGGRAPSPMNGGLEDLAVSTFLVLFLEVAALVDIFEPPDRRAPGDYGFDPMRLQNWGPPFANSVLPPGRLWMQEAEVANGRLAMLAIAYIMAVEYVQKQAIINFL